MASCLGAARGTRPCPPLQPTRVPVDGTQQQSRSRVEATPWSPAGLLADVCSAGRNPCHSNGFAGVHGTTESGRTAPHPMDFRKLCSALRLLETQGNDARIADAQIIALLMERGPQTYEQLCAHLALSNSAVSRTVQRLSAINRKGKPGFGLVAVERDPREGRRYLALLSQKGRVFLEGIGVA